MAITVPPDPYFSGTLSGDMILNSSADLTPTDLFDVVLHEAGLSLGLRESTDPSSVMYSLLNPQATLSAGDIQNIQALYGTPAPDPNASNNSFATAAPISAAAPLPRADAPGGLRRPRHALGYRLLLGAAPPPLRRVGDHPAPDLGDQLPATRLEVYDQNDNLLGQAQSTSDVGRCRVGHISRVSIRFSTITSRWTAPRRTSSGSVATPCRSHSTAGRS